MRQLPILILSIAFLVGCHKKTLSPEEQRHVTESSIGITASIAASLHVDAERACFIAGTEQMSDCANSLGTLVPERAAKMAATMSISRTKHFFDKCIVEFSSSYCNDLLERAIKIERRKPASSEPEIQSYKE